MSNTHVSKYSFVGLENTCVTKYSFVLAGHPWVVVRYGFTRKVHSPAVYPRVLHTWMSGPAVGRVLVRLLYGGRVAISAMARLGREP